MLQQIIPPAESPRVLIVENDDSLAVMLRYNLEAAGYSAEVVTDGLAALREIIDRPPQLVLLDWNLPRLSGIEVLRRLRRLRAAEVPIVMLTARTDPDDRARALALGADAYIAKPFALRDLLGVLADLLERELAVVPAE